jgi:hypothetical protein
MFKYNYVGSLGPSRPKQTDAENFPICYQRPEAVLIEQTLAKNAPVCVEMLEMPWLIPTQHVGSSTTPGFRFQRFLNVSPPKPFQRFLKMSSLDLEAFTVCWNTYIFLWQEHPRSDCRQKRVNIMSRFYCQYHVTARRAR